MTEPGSTCLKVGKGWWKEMGGDAVFGGHPGFLVNEIWKITIQSYARFGRFIFLQYDLLCFLAVFLAEWFFLGHEHVTGMIAN